MLVFRMNKQFPNEIKKTHKAKEDIVTSKVKMNMIHEAFLQYLHYWWRCWMLVF